MDLGAQLYGWRTKLGLTLNQVVERTMFRVSQSTLTKAEQGDESMRWRVLVVVVCDGLGLDIPMFFGSSPTPQTPKRTTRKARKVAA